MTAEQLVARLLARDATLFEGPTAERALGWLDHPQRFLGPWLDEVDERRPRRHPRALLLGMGGSSSPARFFAESIGSDALRVLDTSNPDTVAATDFSEAIVVASSKSGTTIETQCLLAHALAHGLDAADLVIVTDPGTTLGELGRSLGAFVIEGDPSTGGRFSGLSPFGLVPALYAGWTREGLREELAGCEVSAELVTEAVESAASYAAGVVDGAAMMPLDGDPIVSGAALWLEQLVAETTGKAGRGVIPLSGEGVAGYRPARLQHWHLVAALLAWHLGVDPFDQPDVEAAKRDGVALLTRETSWEEPELDRDGLRRSLRDAHYVTLQAYAPLEAAAALSDLRRRVDAAVGPTTANLGPRYLHSTGQLHKGGPHGVVAVQVLQRPRSAPRRVHGRGYSFHDLHRAQANGDLCAMLDAGRRVHRIVVDDLAEAAQLLEVAS